MMLISLSLHYKTFFRMKKIRPCNNLALHTQIVYQADHFLNYHMTSRQSSPSSRKHFLIINVRMVLRRLSSYFRG